MLCLTMALPPPSSTVLAQQPFATDPHAQKGVPVQWNAHACFAIALKQPLDATVFRFDSECPVPCSSGSRSPVARSSAASLREPDSGPP